MRKTTALLLLAACPLQAFSARPFVTDDARLTTAESCQLETWMRVYPNSREVWALPACNPTGNLELTVGGGRAKNDGEKPTADQVFQLKTLFRPLESNGWGWGMAVGTIRHPEINPGPNQLGNTYVYAPFSMSMADDRIVAHVNVGMLKDRESKQKRTTWGMGGEFKLTPRFLAIAETFGDDRNKPYWQVGGRYAIVPDKVQVDATLGQQFSGNRTGRWISFGLRLTPEKLF